MRKKIFPLLTLLLFVTTAAAFANANNTTASSPPASAILYCPQPSELVLDPNKLTWSAKRNSFRSYDISFSTKIDKFAGAQWTGANVGQITCVYKTLPKTSFPVLLIFHTLTLSPEGGAWTKDLGGYKNCNSLDRKACPFIIRLRHKQTDVYKEAESLKSISPEPPTK